MSSLFTDTHNVVAILEKSDSAEGFEQIIDFLSGSYIHYALTGNPHIYISCIKQFWNIASVKCSDDITRLQALVDKKKIVISEVVIREILQLDDAEGVGMLAARQPAEEGLAEAQVQADDAVVAAVEENVTEDVPHDAIPSPPSHDIPSPSQEPSSPPQQPHSLPQAPPQGEQFPTHIQQILNVCSALTRRVKDLENDNAAQKLEIIKLQARVKRLERANQVKSSKLRRLRKCCQCTISATKPSIPAAAPTVVAAYTRRRNGVIIRDPEEELSSKTPAETPKLKDKGKGILVETPKPMKKKNQIELDADDARKLHEEINRDHEEFNKDID
nr:hypothetical protein [Tanacetum cinerariifolium]